MIKKVVSETGYMPDGIAGSLRSGKTYVIGVILTDVSDPLMSTWAKDVEKMLSEKSYSTILMNTAEKYHKEEEAIYLSLKKKVGGIIICPTQENSGTIKYLIKINMPFILLVSCQPCNV